MTDTSRLETALRNADAAGDTAAARTLAAEITRLRAAPPPPVWSGSILPFSKDAKGQVSFDTNAGIIGAAKRAFNLPGEVMRGEVDPKSDQGIARAMEMATVVSPVNPAVRAGSLAVPGPVQAAAQKVKPPTAEALHQAADAGYDAARNMAVDYSASSVKTMADGVRRQLESDGILGELAPKTFSLLQKLTSPPEGGIAPLTGIEAARRAFGHAAKDFSNPTEQLAARRAIDGIDEFVARSDPASVVAGPASAAASLFEKSRANFAAAKRSDRITGAEEAAELGAKANNSGANVGNSIRQRAKGILLDPKKRAGFNDEEIAALESVVRGTATQNVLRRVGNLFGGGGGLGQFITAAGAGAAGGAAGGGWGAAAGMALPLVGMGARGASNAMTRRALQRTDDLVRSRSPLHSENVGNALYMPKSQTRENALLRLLMTGAEAEQ